MARLRKIFNFFKGSSKKRKSVVIHESRSIRNSEIPMAKRVGKEGNIHKTPSTTTTTTTTTTTKHGQIYEQFLYIDDGKAGLQKRTLSVAPSVISSSNYTQTDCDYSCDSVNLLKSENSKIIGGGGNNNNNISRENSGRITINDFSGSRSYIINNTTTAANTNPTTNTNNNNLSFVINSHSPSNLNIRNLKLNYSQINASFTKPEFTYLDDVQEEDEEEEEETDEEVEEDLGEKETRGKENGQENPQKLNTLFTMGELKELNETGPEEKVLNQNHGVMGEEGQDLRKDNQSFDNVSTEEDNQNSIIINTDMTESILPINSPKFDLTEENIYTKKNNGIIKSLFKKMPHNAPKAEESSVFIDDGKRKVNFLINNTNTGRSGSTTTTPAIHGGNSNGTGGIMSLQNKPTLHHRYNSPNLSSSILHKEKEMAMMKTSSPLPSSSVLPSTTPLTVNHNEMAASKKKYSVSNPLGGDHSNNNNGSAGSSALQNVRSSRFHQPGSRENDINNKAVVQNASAYTSAVPSSASRNIYFMPMPRPCQATLLDFSSAVKSSPALSVSKVSINGAVPATSASPALNAHTVSSSNTSLKLKLKRQNSLKANLDRPINTMASPAITPSSSVLASSHLGGSGSHGHGHTALPSPMATPTAAPMAMSSAQQHFAKEVMASPRYKSKEAYPALASTFAHLNSPRYTTTRESYGTLVSPHYKSKEAYSSMAASSLYKSKEVYPMTATTPFHVGSDHYTTRNPEKDLDLKKRSKERLILTGNIQAMSTPIVDANDNSISSIASTTSSSFSEIPKKKSSFDFSEKMENEIVSPPLTLDSVSESSHTHTTTPSHHHSGSIGGNYGMERNSHKNREESLRNVEEYVRSLEEKKKDNSHMFETPLAYRRKYEKKFANSIKSNASNPSLHSNNNRSGSYHTAGSTPQRKLKQKSSLGSNLSKNTNEFIEESSSVTEYSDDHSMLSISTNITTKTAPLNNTYSLYLNDQLVTEKKFYSLDRHTEKLSSSSDNHTPRMTALNNPNKVNTITSPTSTTTTATSNYLNKEKKKTSSQSLELKNKKNKFNSDSTIINIFKNQKLNSTNLSNTNKYGHTKTMSTTSSNSSSTLTYSPLTLDQPSTTSVNNNNNYFDDFMNDLHNMSLNDLITKYEV